jgi:hypothetical protein
VLETNDTALLEELVIWTRFLARDPLQRALTAILKDSRHQFIYEMTDGFRTQTEIGRLAGVDQTTVSDLWTRWRRAGIVKSTGKRMAHLIALSDLGWDVPPATARRTRESSTLVRDGQT